MEFFCRCCRYCYCLSSSSSSEVSFTSTPSAPKLMKYLTAKSSRNSKDVLFLSPAFKTFLYLFFFRSFCFLVLCHVLLLLLLLLLQNNNVAVQRCILSLTMMMCHSPFSLSFMLFLVTFRFAVAFAQQQKQTVDESDNLENLKVYIDNISELRSRVTIFKSFEFY